MKPNFDKNKNGLLPAIIQDFRTNKVLMLAYMNKMAFEKTLDSLKVTFYSRSRQKLWTKGEESGNFLLLVDIKLDCDKDTFLIKVNPEGPTCHTGADTCWNEKNESPYGFLNQLENIISQRKENINDENSYVSSLFRSGVNKISQKVGEEAVELIIEAKDNNENLFLNEGADLLFHYLILLQEKGFRLNDIVKILKERH